MIKFSAKFIFSAYLMKIEDDSMPHFMIILDVMNQQSEHICEAVTTSFILGKIIYLFISPGDCKNHCLNIPNLLYNKTI